MTLYAIVFIIAVALTIGLFIAWFGLDEDD